MALSTGLQNTLQEKDAVLVIICFLKEALSLEKQFLKKLRKTLLSWRKKVDQMSSFRHDALSPSQISYYLPGTGILRLVTSSFITGNCRHCKKTNHLKLWFSSLTETALASLYCFPILKSVLMVLGICRALGFWCCFQSLNVAHLTEAGVPGVSSKVIILS